MVARKILWIYNYLLRLLYSNSKYPKLPESLFLIGTFFFPQVNVELIIIINSSVLLTWRDDLFGNKGWHLPGGIVRPNELIESRINEVLKTEVKISSEILASHTLLAYSEVFRIIRPSIRSHFISLVYAIQLDSICQSSILHAVKESQDIALFQAIPEDLIENHKRYSNLINNCLKSDVNGIPRI